MKITLQERHWKEIQRVEEVINNLGDKYEDYVLQTKTQLRLSQLQLFQNLASITLAFQGILYIFFVTQADLVLISPFFFTSTTLSLLMVLYCASYGKEVIDETDRHLNGTEQDVKFRRKEFGDVANHTILEDDFTIFEAYIEGIKNTKTKKPTLNFSGEILLVLFCASLLFGIASTAGYYHRVLFLLIPIISIILTFTNWASLCTHVISKRLAALGFS